MTPQLADSWGMVPDRQGCLQSGVSAVSSRQRGAGQTQGVSERAAGRQSTMLQQILCHSLWAAPADLLPGATRLARALQAPLHGMLYRPSPSGRRLVHPPTDDELQDWSLYAENVRRLMGQRLGEPLVDVVSTAHVASTGCWQLT